ncbi:glycosyltransferase family 4 protein [Bacillus sp. BRMEA1]|uniref:glycosyltransferase family 4 protein n=1 Tax=Neobacillus endophyticus TaxID=2738405 RepID=UPI0015658196|nr:glycosyltransferase family 4 protein [Neobacillus endophyticus]NRD76942.1 glycosyltransferase family 4 protein [Neobacillus endophyticus]
MSNLKIGYLWNRYPYQRNVINIVKGAKYIKVIDFFKTISLGMSVMKRFKIPISKDKLINFENKFNDLNINKVDVLHFFNTISYGETPWVSTFETFLPRFSSLIDHQKKEIPKSDRNIEKALSAIAGDSCKKIIALSECTKNFQKELLNVYPKYKKQIENKITVIHPPQKLFVNNFKEKSLNLEDEVSFIFVGKDFFRKGGLEILEVFVNLKSECNLPLKLTIVSSFGINDYATMYGKDEVEFVQKMIRRNSDWIKYYPYLPNNKVLELMRKHHIGLLPTWADTYGYSVLEMQANGCPVITTDVRSLPEINDNDKGWIIKVPKNHLGEALYSNSDQRKILSNTISKQLEEIIKNIIKDKVTIEQKSQNSIKSIKENHSPEKYAQKLASLYKDCV